MFIRDLADQYVLYIRNERRLAKSTVRDSRFHLRRLLEWLEANGYPEPTLDTFNEDVLRRFFYDLCERGLRPRTLIASFYPVRAIGEWLVQRQLLAANPAREITLPKKDAAIRAVCADEDIERLLEACERQPSARKVALCKGVISVLAFAGLRRQELLDLRVDDIDFINRSLTVRSGKGGKSRKVYPCSQCLDALREWVAVRPMCEHDWLWAYSVKRRVHYNGLVTILENLKAIAGLKGVSSIKCHSIRHGAATRLMRNGAPLSDIQHFLGHAHLTTTAIYLHSSEESQRKIAELGAIRPTPEQRTPETDPRRAAGLRWKRRTTSG